MTSCTAIFGLSPRSWSRRSLRKRAPIRRHRSSARCFCAWDFPVSRLTRWSSAWMSAACSATAPGAWSWSLPKGSKFPSGPPALHCSPDNIGRSCGGEIIGRQKNRSARCFARSRSLPAQTERLDLAAQTGKSPACTFRLPQRLRRSYAVDPAARRPRVQ